MYKVNRSNVDNIIKYDEWLEEKVRNVAYIINLIKTSGIKGRPI